MKRIPCLLLLCALLSACNRNEPDLPPVEPPPVVKPEPEKKDSDTEKSDLETGPEQVAGLTASSRAAGIRLAWQPSTGASSYEVYEYIPFWDIEFRLVAEVTEANYIETTAYLNESYDFYVIAVNDWGKAEASETLSYTYVPTFWQPVDENYPVAVSGGDVGDVSVTAFAGFGDIQACTETGVGITQTRPAEGSSLAATQQTFTLDLAYKLATAEEYEISVESFDSGVETYYSDFGTLDPGCGTRTFSFTLDLRWIRASSLYVYFYSESFGARYVYSKETGSLHLIDTVPEAGSSLTTGTLAVNFAYADLPTGMVEAYLSAGAIFDSALLGATTATIQGTGALQLQIPYQAACGYDNAQLSVWFSGGPLDLSFERSFGLSATGAVSPRLSKSNYRFSLKANPDFYVSEGALLLNACPGSPMPVTVTGSNGVVIHNETSNALGANVVGTTSDKFTYWLTASYVYAQLYGEHATSVTVRLGASAVTLPITFSNYDYFFTTPPPETGVALQSYPVVATGVNTPPTPVSLIIDSWQSGSSRYWLAWNGSAYAANLVFPACGYYNFRLGYQYENLSTEIQSGGPYMQSADSIFFSFWDGGASTTSGAYIGEQCNRPFQWQVESAPSWVRFDVTAGIENDILFASVFHSEIPLVPSRYGGFEASGVIVLSTDIDGFSVIIPVSTYYDPDGF